MSLWKKTENLALAGNYSGNVGTTTVTSTGVANLSAIVANGTNLYTSPNGDAFFTVSGVSGNTITVSANLASAVSGTLYTRNAPKWVKDPAYADKLSVVTTADAQNTDFIEVGLDTPGWVYSVTYVDQNSKTRTKTEVLTTFKS